MSNTIISTNMSLPIPIAGQDPGPDYALNLNSCLSIIDSHTHSPGSGVQITPSGININSTLPFNGQSATNLNFVNFISESGTIPNLTAYSNGTDLYYKDSTGTAIQMTKNSGPNAGTGNIQNLPSTPIGSAGISWINAQSTFQFLIDAGTTGANLDVGTLIVRYPGSYPTPSGNAVVLQAPSAISGVVAITLPVHPSVSSNMVMTSSGVIGFTQTSASADPVGAAMSSTGANAVGSSMTSTGANAVAASVTMAVTTNGTNPGIGGISTATPLGSPGYISTTSASYVTCGNQFVLQTSGRAVLISLSTQSNYFNYWNVSNGQFGDLQLQNTTNSTVIGSWRVTGQVQAQQWALPGTVIDTSVVGTPGTYTYQWYYRTTGGAVLVSGMNPCAVEL